MKVDFSIIKKVWGYIPDCFKWFRDIFSEDNGNPSYTRISSAIVLANIMTNWSLVIYHDWKWIPLDTGTVAVIGLLVAGKIVQKFAEGNAVRPPSMPSSPPSGNSSAISAPENTPAESPEDEKPPKVEI